MKTTVQIPDSLFKEARKVAKEEHTTMKALIETGLRRIIAEHRKRERFHLRKVSFKGKGLQQEFEGASWEKLREAGYEGRGG
ncbi:MAG: hypothetical protein OHK006_03820 [Thermodesulfovibrionales bacterium]